MINNKQVFQRDLNHIHRGTSRIVNGDLLLGFARAGAYQPAKLTSCRQVMDCHKNKGKMKLLENYDECQSHSSDDDDDKSVDGGVPLPASMRPVPSVWVQQGSMPSKEEGKHPNPATTMATSSSHTKKITWEHRSKKELTLPYRIHDSKITESRCKAVSGIWPEPESPLANIWVEKPLFGIQQGSARLSQSPRPSEGRPRTPQYTFAESQLLIDTPVTTSTNQAILMPASHSMPMVPSPTSLPMSDATNETHTATTHHSIDPMPALQESPTVLSPNGALTPKAISGTPTATTGYSTDPVPTSDGIKPTRSTVPVSASIATYGVLTPRPTPETPTATADDPTDPMSASNGITETPSSVPVLAPTLRAARSLPTGLSGHAAPFIPRQNQVTHNPYADMQPMVVSSQAHRSFPVQPHQPALPGGPTEQEIYRNSAYVARSHQTIAPVPWQHLQVQGTFWNRTAYDQNQIEAALAQARAMGVRMPPRRRGGGSHR